MHISFSRAFSTVGDRKFEMLTRKEAEGLLELSDAHDANAPGIDWKTSVSQPYTDECLRLPQFSDVNIAKLLSDWLIPKD